MNAFVSTLIFIVAGFVQIPAKRPVLPNDDVRCGSYCLTVAATASGTRAFTLEEVEAVLGEPGARGFSLLQLNDAARKLGFETVNVRTSTRNLEFRRRAIGERFACVTSFGTDHFVLVYGSDGKIVRIADPPRTYTLDIPVFEKDWSGNCLLIGTEPLSTEESVMVAMRNRALAKRVGATLAAVLLAALAGAVIMRLRNRKISPSTSVSTFLCVLMLVTVGCADPLGESALSGFASNDLAKSETIQGSQIEIVPARHSLGKVRGGQGQRIPIESTIRNTSGEVLKIGKVTVSCGCTQVSIDKPELKPGESARLTAHVEVGESQVVRSSRIRIESSDRLRPLSEIEIDWEADLPLKTEPASVVRHDLPASGNSEIEIAVISKYVSLCENCEVRTSMPPRSLKFDWAPNTDLKRPGHSGTSADLHETKLGTLRCEIQPEDVELHHREEVRIELTCRDETVAIAALPLNWTFRRAYGVSPSRVFFGTLQSGQSATKSLVVRSLDGERLRIRSVRFQNQDLPLDSRIENVSDKEAHIRITFKAPDKNGPWTDEIVVETESKEQPVIRLPASCLVE